MISASILSIKENIKDNYKLVKYVKDIDLDIGSYFIVCIMDIKKVL